MKALFCILKLYPWSWRNKIQKKLKHIFGSGPLNTDFVHWMNIKIVLCLMLLILHKSTYINSIKRAYWISSEYIVFMNLLLNWFYLLFVLFAWWFKVVTFLTIQGIYKQKEELWSISATKHKFHHFHLFSFQWSAIWKR